MNAETFRSIPEQIADENALPSRLERKLHDAMRQRVADGDVLILSDEEIQMVKSFRRFRAAAKKNGEVFRWQTTRDDREIVSGEEMPLIVDPMTEPAVR